MNSYLIIKEMFEAQANQDKALQMAQYMRNQFVFLWFAYTSKKTSL